MTSLSYSKEASYHFNDVPIHKSWKIRFSIELNPNSVTTKSITLTDHSGSKHSINVRYDNPTKTIEVTPKEPLSFNERYQLTLSSFIESSTNIPLDHDVSIFLNTESKDNHPRSLVGNNHILSAKAKALSQDWAKQYKQYLLKEANKWLSNDITVPSEGAGHSSFFLCENGTRLEYRSTPDPDGYYCPSENKYYEGERYDAGWRFFRMEELIIGLRHLADAYVLTDDERYAERATHILVQLSENYPNYSLQSKHGKLYWQSLDESVALIDISFAYDLIYSSSSIDVESHNKIQLFLKASAETISHNPMGLSNWQAWHNAAIGMVGAVTGDKALISTAINGDEGALYLLNKGVLDDGFWWEGSIAYHMYTLTAFNILAEVGDKWGFSLYDNPKLKAMFDTPIQYSYPNYQLPANNDGGTFGQSLIGSISSRGYYEYEAAYAHYKDSLYGQLLKMKYDQPQLRRNGDFALFFGKELPLIENRTNDVYSTLFESIGHGILRNQLNQYALLDYGTHGGSHGHYDKLHLDYFTNNELFGADPGTSGYSHPLHNIWYKQTYAHNTVIVDGQSQEATSGKLVQFHNQPPFNIIHASANGAYPGVDYERMVWMDNDLLIDWFWAEDEESQHTYDWIFHGMGSFKSDQLMRKLKKPIIFNNAVDTLLQNTYSQESNSTWRGSWRSINQKGTGFISLSDGSTKTILVANTPGNGNSPEALLKTSVIQRTKGKQGTFTSIFYPLKDEVKATLKDSNTIEIEKDNLKHYYYYNHKPQYTDVVAAKSTNPDISTLINELTYHKKGNSLYIQSKELPSQTTFSIVAPAIKEVYWNNSKLKVVFKDNHIYLAFP